MGKHTFKDVNQTEREVKVQKVKKPALENFVNASFILSKNIR